MEVIVMDYPQGVILQHGESFPHAILRAEEEGIRREQHTLGIEKPYVTMPGNTCQYRLTAKGERKVCIEMRPQFPIAEIWKPDRQGFLLSLKGRRRATLSLHGRQLFPLVERVGENLCVQKVIFLSSFHQEKELHPHVII